MLTADDLVIEQKFKSPETYHVYYKGDNIGYMMYRNYYFKARLWTSLDDPEIAYIAYLPDSQHSFANNMVRQWHLSLAKIGIVDSIMANPPR